MMGRRCGKDQQNKTVFIGKEGRQHTGQTPKSATEILIKLEISSRYVLQILNSGIGPKTSPALGLRADTYEANKTDQESNSRFGYNL